MAYTGVHLPVAAFLTDWSHRPLDEEQLEYAEDDVRYLPSIYQQMTDELVRLNRLGWVLPEMEDLADPARYRHDPRKAYLKLKRSGSRLVASCRLLEKFVLGEICVQRIVIFRVNGCCLTKLLLRSASFRQCLLIVFSKFEEWIISQSVML